MQFISLVKIHNILILILKTKNVCQQNEHVPFFKKKKEVEHFIIVKYLKQEKKNVEIED